MHVSGENLKFRICPSTQLLYDSYGMYLYRASDSQAWGADIVGVPPVADVMYLCNSWSEQQQIVDALSIKHPFENVCAAIKCLLDAEILIIQDHPLASEMTVWRHSESWIINDWREAFDFHIHTNRLVKVDYSSAGQRDELDILAMKRYVDESEPPCNYKRFSSYEAIVPLMNFSLVADLRANDTKRRSYVFDHVSNRQIDIKTVSYILNLTYAQTGVVSMAITGSHLRKPAPSGGARHPSECYILVRDVVGIDQGVYHYNTQKHALYRLTVPKNSLDKLSNAVRILRRSKPGDLAFAMITTSIFERSMHRYRESRSYRVINFDIGHLVANAFVAASVIGLRFQNTYSFPEDVVESLLGLNPFAESAMNCSLVFKP